MEHKGECRHRIEVLCAKIDIGSLEHVRQRVLAWGRVRDSRYVAVCNAHVVVTATTLESYRQVINDADLAIPDGAPVAWMMRRLGASGQRRVTGPDLMWALCESCAHSHLPIYLLGGSEKTLRMLSERLSAAFPGLLIAGVAAPPFRPLTPAEDSDLVSQVNASGAALVFVALGCPKQEAWMAAHKGRIAGVMLGVGAAFDFHAGTVRRAPHWIQRVGMEWFHRLLSEPRRLWRRYLVTNTLFVVWAARQLLRAQRRKQAT